MKKVFDLDNYYLAGLIEGDGTIYVPKTQRCIKTNKILYPTIEIIFHKKDLSLAENIRSFLNFGYILNLKNKNAYKLHINNKEDIYKMINLLNGKFKTPKINKLHALIQFVNYRDNQNIPLLPKNSENIKDNSWLTGFAEADSCFYIRINEKESSVSCVFEIDQRMIDISGESCKDFMKGVGDFLNVKIHETKRGKYTLKASSKQSKEIIINYFSKYPLKGAKFLDYTDWYKVINIIQNSGNTKVLKNKENFNLDKIRLIKSQMNSKRPF